MSDIVERLRAGTAGLTLYEIEALWGEAATALSSMDAKPSVAAQNDVLYQLSRITENDIPLDMWEIRSIVKAAMQEMARLRRLERSTAAADAITTLRAALESVDEKALEAAMHAYICTVVTNQGKMDLLAQIKARGIGEVRKWMANNPMQVSETRAAISAYLAALKERVKP